MEGQKTPLMIRKSDGGYGYGTTDMATLYNRIHVSTWQPFCCRECHTFVCLPNSMQRSPHGDRGAQEMRARMLHAEVRVRGWMPDHDFLCADAWDRTRRGSG